MFSSIVQRTSKKGKKMVGLGAANFANMPMIKQIL